jgi:hypothetical protein
MSLLLFIYSPYLSLLYSDYFYSFLTSEEHNEAVSHIKLGHYAEAVPLLETIFHIREKLLTAGNILVLLCLCELVACLAAIDRIEEAFAYTQVCCRIFITIYFSKKPDC